MHSSNMYTQSSGVLKSAYIAVGAFWGGVVNGFLSGWNCVN